MQMEDQKLYGFSDGKIKSIDVDFFSFLGNNYALYPLAGHLLYEDFDRDSLKPGPLHTLSSRKKKIRDIGVVASVYVKNGLALFLDEHIRRLIENARASSVTISMNDPGIRIAIRSMDVARRNSGIEHAINIMLFNDSFIGKNKSLDERCCISSYLIKSPKDNLIGVGAVSYRGFKRKQTTNLHLNLAERMFLLEAFEYADSRDPYEAIIIDNKGNCAGCVNSSIFCVYENNLCIPREVIAGDIIKERIIKTAREIGIRIAIGEISYPGLLRAEEVFTANSTNHIVPITSIDGRAIGNGRVGRITKNIAREMAILDDDYVRFYKRLC